MEIAGRIAEWLSTGPNRVGEPGLSEAELCRAEETFGLTFPPLLREVLALVHPVPRPIFPQPGLHQAPSRVVDWRVWTGCPVTRRGRRRVRSRIRKRLR